MAIIKKEGAGPKGWPGVADDGGTDRSEGGKKRDTGKSDLEIAGVRGDRDIPSSFAQRCEATAASPLCLVVFHYLSSGKRVRFSQFTPTPP